MTSWFETAKKQRILVDDDVYKKYKDVNWYLNKGGYACCHNDGMPPRYLHRLIMQTPKGMHTDHINGDKLDNRSVNLRVCTPSENTHGFTRRKNPSGLRGVTKVISRGGKRNGRWTAQITKNYVHIYLGTFPTKELAHEAYLKAK